VIDNVGVVSVSTNRVLYQQDGVSGDGNSLQGSRDSLNRLRRGSSSHQSYKNQSTNPNQASIAKSEFAAPPCSTPSRHSNIVRGPFAGNCHHDLGLIHDSHQVLNFLGFIWPPNIEPKPIIDNSSNLRRWLLMDKRSSGRGRGFERYRTDYAACERIEFVAERPFLWQELANRRGPRRKGRESGRLQSAQMPINAGNGKPNDRGNVAEQRHQNSEGQDSKGKRQRREQCQRQQDNSGRPVNPKRSSHRIQ
jgi:hypothetical protein